MQTKNNRGFTLIELLVVIAIIGVLSAVVLASLNTARSKGNDAAIQSDLATIQVQAELMYSTLSNNYNSNTGATLTSGACSTLTTGTTPATTGTFLTDATIMNALKGAKSVSPGATGDSDCGITSSAYSIAVPTSGGVWCIDSTGVARGKNSAGNTYSGITTGSYPAHMAGNSGASGATSCS